MASFTRWRTFLNRDQDNGRGRCITIYITFTLHYHRGHPIEYLPNLESRATWFFAGVRSFWHLDFPNFRRSIMLLEGGGGRDPRLHKRWIMYIFTTSPLHPVIWAPWTPLQAQGFYAHFDNDIFCSILRKCYIGRAFGTRSSEILAEEEGVARGY